MSNADGSTVTLPATLSRTIITDILRGDMGFDGVVITDAMNMDAIRNHFLREDAAKFAINAGVDILLMPVDMYSETDISDMENYISAICEMAKRGDINIEKIDKAVARILRLKYKYGIMDYSNKANIDKKIANARNIVGSQKHRELEIEIARIAVTVVKNDSVFPLDIAKDTLILFPYENDSRLKLIESAVREISAGGNASAGAGGSVGKSSSVAIRSYENLAASDFAGGISKADTVVAFIDTSRLPQLNPNDKSGWQSVFINALIEKAHSQNKKIIVVSVRLPYDTAHFPEADAVIATLYHRGASITAAVQCIFGNFSPTGKMPVRN